jgi:hypothetical protein
MISSEQDPDFASLMGRLKDADHFDTYMLGYVKDMSLADAPSAIGLLMKIQHFATLPMPSWMKIRDHLKVLLKNEPEALEHIGWLMAQGGLKAKAHAFSLSYNILEYSFGRTLIKSQKIPIYKDLNNSFAPPPADIDEKLADVEGHCTDQSADKLRQYSNTLRQEGWGLGIM